MAAESRSVWTPKDEALLSELIERRDRIRSENRETLSEVLGIIHGEIVDLDHIIGNADAVIEALLPFATDAWASKPRQGT